MKVLVAEDDLVSCEILQEHLTEWGFNPIVVNHGRDALELLKRPDAPHLALLDWMMPYLSGPELCQAVQKLQKPITPYLILLTAKTHKVEVVRALLAGAHDYVTKPFDPNELHARLNVGRRTIELQLLLAERVAELEAARNPANAPRACSRCEKVRQPGGNWARVDGYVSPGDSARLSHVLCPECYSTIAVFLGVNNDPASRNAA